MLSKVSVSWAKPATMLGSYGVGEASALEVGRLLRPALPAPELLAWSAAALEGN